MMRSTQTKPRTAAYDADSSRGPLALLLGSLGVAALLALSPLAEAGSHEHDHGDEHAHGDHQMDDQEHADDPAVQAYREANERMHEGMMGGFTGDADVDFARGMIPHHQGAIDMANIVLEYGEDEALQQLAREIIDAQEEEIAFLEAWLEEHGH
ncbi:MULTISPECIES: DUF305 domain-containing protein [Halomonas]|uniref:DUF305 domain-containing protein n=1 Tax=Halomonas chromatireducens TaxID=507626 RepID=A0A0X8HB45_9GAMM|nr:MULTISPECIES: DUF305 domain-containing protein [Halomonas]AMC99384.1 hypothetical protein LOKO_00288 [Halomonas chromatireducens]